MKSLIVGLFSLTVIACGGQVGEETVRCETVATTPHQAGDTTQLGFSAQQVLDAVAGQETLVLTWADNTTTTATLTTTYTGGPIEFQQRVWQDDGSLAEIDVDCDDTVVIPIELRLETDDGAFQDTWLTSIEAEIAEYAQLSQEFATLTGSFDLDAFAPQGQWDQVRAWLDLTLEPTGATGVISGQAEGTDGEVAFAEAFDVATLGAASN